jgi:glycosyltransferase involved in cell wall biosynthesis
MPHVEAFHSMAEARLVYALDAGHVSPPVVSVIVTSFNYGKYIEACLASIATQTYRHFECVIVDDASTDDSIEVVESFIARQRRDGEFRLVRHADNQGQMAAFQTGLQHTTGSFVVFVDADDLLFPDFIETHVKAHLNSARMAAFTNSELIQISADGQVLSGIQGMGGTPDMRAARTFDGHDWELTSAGGFALRQAQPTLKYCGPWEVGSLGWIWSTTSAAMFRRAVLDAIMSPESRCLRICADRYLFNFSHGLGGSLIINTVHGCYRRHGSNAFSRNPMLGGDSFLGDLCQDPGWVANKLIFQHLLRHFERFSRVLVRPFIKSMLRHYGPPRRRDKVILALKTWYRMKREGLPLWGADPVRLDSRVA